MLKNLLYISGLTLLVVVIFIGADLYMDATKTTIPPTTQKNLKPINGKFDTSAVEGLKSRKQIEVDLSAQNIITTPKLSITPTSKNISTTITVSPSTSPTLSSTLTPSPTRGL